MVDPAGAAGPQRCVMDTAGSGSRSVECVCGLRCRHARKALARSINFVLPRRSPRMPLRRAAEATPTGALPCRVCSSRHPSPVITRSTPRRCRLEIDEFEDEVDARPGLRPQHAHHAEGGPAGRARARGAGVVVAGGRRRHGGPSLHRLFEDDQIRTASALLGRIHRCGTVRARAAGCPRRRPPRNRARRAAGCRPARSRRAASTAPRHRWAAAWPAASRISTPSACSSPAPPSVEALPPSPTTISRAPRSSADRMMVPSPNVVAPRGSKARSGSWSSPTAAASSTTAVVPRVRVGGA